MARDDFSENTKKRLASRAGYLCSICNNITVGPSEESVSSVNLTGVAAHISAASSGPGARRYDSSLTSEERSSIENGIWLCNTHADLIDGDEKDFTTPYLKLIKKNHEEKVKLKHLGINTDKGVITKIDFSNFGPVTTPLSLEFADNNIVLGNNSIGKTLTLELLSSLNDRKKIKRWVNSSRPKINSYYNIHYFKNQPEKFSISIDSDNNIDYAYNDSPIPFLISKLSIFHIDISYWRFVNSLSEKKRENLSVLDKMSKYFKLKKREFIGLIGTIMRNKKFFCNDISIDYKDEELLAKMDPTSHAFPFSALSGGEQDRVLLEVTLKIADYYSKYNSTLLLIENTSFSTLDSTGINRLFEIIENEKFAFQFIFSTVGDRNYNYRNFKVLHLKKSSKGTIIT